MTLDELRRTRPRDWFLRISAIGFAALLLGAWLLVDIGWPDPERASRNLARFGSEIWPPFSLDWLARVVRLDVIANTVAIAIVGTGLATVGGALAVAVASRTVAAPDPWVSEAPRSGSWALLRGVARLGLLFLRSIPEYVWAFLLVALLGLSAWPAVLALAIHNTGILGRLFTETVDDVEPAAPRVLRGLGGGRLAVFATGVVPQVQGRWLLYVFVRWESCVREATVVGLVGVVSLGWAIREARARTHYDEMVGLVAVGALLILASDALSLWLRSRST